MGTIDDYLASLDPADRDVIARVYAIAREEVPGAEHQEEHLGKTSEVQRFV